MNLERRTSNEANSRAFHWLIWPAVYRKSGDF